MSTSIIKRDELYITNLTDSLIGSHGYDCLFGRIRRAEFIRHVKTALESDEVARMRPETLGKILGSLHIGDVMASKAELLDNLHFAGDCEDLLRELTAISLAFVIWDRLGPRELAMSSFPPYRASRR